MSKRNSQDKKEKKKEASTECVRETPCIKLKTAQDLYEKPQIKMKPARDV